MSGNRNSGRRPPEIARPNFSAPAPAEPSASEFTRPGLSSGAAAKWEEVVAEAGQYGTVTLPLDGATLAKICEQLAVMDFVIKAKSGKRFSPLSDRGLRVVRLERQTTKEIDRLWKALRREIENRARPRGVALGASVPSIRDFASRRGPVSA